mmetsp:Transcript_11505/g.34107  ORF Transcript_11505/g.34107 Transcript_11505/m.34107 type:complete len:216 (+) Transcript_11505:32-679(+)
MIVIVMISSQQGPGCGRGLPPAAPPRRRPYGTVARVGRAGRRPAGAGRSKAVSLPCRPSRPPAIIDSQRQCAVRSARRREGATTGRAHPLAARCRAAAAGPDRSAHREPPRCSRRRHGHGAQAPGMSAVPPRRGRARVAVSRILGMRAATLLPPLPVLLEGEAYGLQEHELLHVLRLGVGPTGHGSRQGGGAHDALEGAWRRYVLRWRRQVLVGS